VTHYKFQILNGNNSDLVRRVLKNSHRAAYWQELPNSTASNFHFRWTPISRQINYERLSFNFVQVTNHLEHHGEVSRKNELMKNMKNLYEMQNENVF
jgi:hypothetical protein